MELIRKASYPDVEQLSQVLARSFAKEEFWTWAVNAHQISEQEKQQRLERVFKIQLTQFALPYHHVYCDENMLGAALWSPPNQWHLNLITQIGMIPDFIKITGLSRLWKVNQVIDQIQKYHPKQPHYYLQVLGVDPNAQGKGLSRHLISPILKQCDLQKMPAYLETATVSNISLYRHFGFELKHTITGLSHNAPEIYCMWRQPRSENNGGYSEH